MLVEDAAFVAFLEEWLACHSAPARKIFKGKASDFRKCFDALVRFLPALSIPQRFRIRQFAGSAPVILEQATANLRLLRLHLSVSVPVGLRNPPSTPLYPPEVLGIVGLAARLLGPLA